ncbi:MAG: hypothetical protein ACP5E9_08330 [Candidatus Methanospirareceae archaeon]
MLRVLPVRELTDGNTAKRVVNRIIADEFDYTRVSLWDGKAELVMTGEIKTGDMLSITNASVSGPQAGGVKRAHAGRYARVAKSETDIVPLRHAAVMRVKRIGSSFTAAVWSGSCQKKSSERFYSSTLIPPWTLFSHTEGAWD